MSTIPQHVCAVCRQPLSHVVPDDGGPAFWKHGVEPSGHEVQPVPRVEMDEERLNPVCDFCMETGDRNTSWVYPTQAFEVQDETGKTHNIDDGNGWGACAKCYRLIEADNRDALAARAATLAERRDGRPYDVFIDHVHKAHGIFFMARSGPAVPAAEFTPEF